LLERDYAGVGELVLQPGLQCIEHVQGRVHDFRADAVATDYRNGLSHWGIFQLVAGRDRERTAACVSRLIMPEHAPACRPEGPRAYCAPSSSGSSWPARCNASMSSSPPTWVSPMKICGTLVRRVSSTIFVRSAGSRSIRTSFQVRPWLVRKFSAATQYGHTAVE